MSDPEHIFMTRKVEPHQTSARFDQVLAEIMPEYSRAKLQSWIKSGQIRLDDRTVKPKEKVLEGQTITVDVIVESVVNYEKAESVDFDVVYEDEALIIVNKPAGLVVHPAAGNYSNTLLNGLLHKYPELEAVPRAGIVHRLDKDTTGLMVVARTLPAHANLVAQLQERTVSRHYHALVHGVMTAGSTIETLIGRHPKNRQKQAVLAVGGKDAITHYRVEERFAHHTLIRCELETGRTHQIRVHMAHAGYPLVGDPLYGGRPKIPKGASKAQIAALQNFGRQALHAFRLGLVHPVSEDYCEWEIPDAPDIEALMSLLKQEPE
ncbi:MAG: 23S rRNA pseudouridine(1911/1915/1917) synthase RluD [Cellvibrionales bacterium]|nr:23S rRNA pseudouridine(1911/1915/1917) synthase RluD [Cellvibrionales bacterium]